VSAQLSLDDAFSERDRALEAVEEHADAEWLAEALTAVYRTAERLPNFIPDDVWITGLEATREDRALGPVLLRASRMGWIAKDPEGRTRPSKRSHGSGKPVWISHLWMGL
jgi:hypothetical protein